jgi:uncharacterized protein (DUF2225 family)
MTRVGRQTLTCPNCGHDFDTEVLFSHTSAGLTSEFRRIALSMPPEAFQVHTCTTCGLSGWDTVFETGVSPQTAALVAEHLVPLVVDGRPPAWIRHEYAAQVAQWQHEAEDEVGYLYLCAAWCAEDRSVAPADVDRYRRRAIEHYRRALDDPAIGGRMTGNQRAEVTYLVGELHRRVGDAEEADRWLAQVAGLVENDETGERLAALAQRQRSAPSDTI